MKQLLGDFNLNKDEKSEIISILKRLDKNFSVAFKQNDFLKTRYSADYKRAIKSGNLVEYMRICSNVLKGLPRENILRTRIYSDLLAVTDRIQKSTGNPRFRVLNEELRAMSRKGRKMDPARIVFKLLASSFVMGQSGTAELTIQNRNPVQVEAEVMEVSSETSEVSVSGSKKMSLAINEKKSLRLLLTPNVPGTLLLKIVAELRADGTAVKREEFFELTVKDAAKEVAVVEPQKSGSPVKMPESASIPDTSTQQEIPAQSASSASADYNIEDLIKKGKAEEWTKIIGDLIEEEASVDLSAVGSDLYEKRGYRNLLTSMFLIDTDEYSQKEINSVIRGDSFTSRGIELLLRLRKEKRIELSPSMSDPNYMKEALNIMTNNYDKSPMEKKKIKEWNIKAGNQHIVVNKEVLKDETGRAKSLIFVLKME